MRGFNIPPTAVRQEVVSRGAEGSPRCRTLLQRGLIPTVFDTGRTILTAILVYPKGRAAAFDPHAPENRSSADMRLSRLLLLALAAYAVYAQSSLPRAPGAHVVTISPPNSHGSE